MCRGRLRNAWTALALGLLAWTVGEILWAYQEIILGQIAFPDRRRVLPDLPGRCG